MGDYRIQVKHHLGPADVAEISDLLAAVTADDHHPPLDEEQWLAMRGGATAMSALLAHEIDDAELVGYAQLSDAHGVQVVEIAVHPEHRGGFEHLEMTLLAGAVEEAHVRGGGMLRYWVVDASAQHDANAAALGFSVERDLLQLRVPLPLSPAVMDGAAIVAVRPFRPGADEAAWLQVNNRAFADHPEQGGWDLATIEGREGLSWFDPEDFLVLEEDGRIVASCWTKVHADTDPPLGEIYVISVDPDHHGRGLGRALTVAGLDHLARRGLAVGMLYVDGTNDAAVALYRSLGFTLDHVDRAYVLDVPAQAPDAPTARPIP